ncbi:hypothetical protein [Nocardiopsis suaedae]|uniref:Uncharacterized protein n=1 Tax=Nocardiopsis suaedae TaxID=3018444 RepID=A0ABT4TVI5_9ACTN|nr:hypothetical protein [Nocardiopsis suaedae]MDA2808152.1 hypothetical protein [Nocardiopsis suaedae]
MGEEVMLAMAAAVAGKTTELLTQGAKDSVAALRKALRKRFGDGTPEREALDEARDADGEDEVLVGTLAGHIRDAAERHDDVRTLVTELAPHFTVTEHNTFTNNVSGGRQGKVWQISRLEGGFHING